MDALKAPACVQEEDCHKRSKRVNATVFNGSRPAGDETLVVFICQRKQTGNDYSADSAAGVPAFQAAESEGMIEK
jgi:hypothetical protein